MDWIVDLFNKLIEFLYRLLISLADMLKDLFFWILESIMALAYELVEGAVTFFAPVDVSSYFSGIPAGAAWVLSQIGLPQAMVMIIAALGVRMLLQLIPFTRLGS